jgi:outer membrane protein assembly factor BamD (BamD/ComL family)
MKKLIVPIIALVLGLSYVSAFAKENLKPIEAKELKNKDAKKEFKQGIKAFKKANYSEAVTHFEAAEKAEPTAPEPHINLGLALAREGKVEEAKKHFDLAATLLAQSGSQAGKGGAGSSQSPSTQNNQSPPAQSTPSPSGSGGAMK